MADAAQSFGASYGGKKVGTLGDITITSFFPSKPLGCYGDGGALFTHRKDLALLLSSLRLHGQGVETYTYTHVGMNSRLDTLQAAILLEKLKIFPQELLLRQSIADFYTQALESSMITPRLSPGSTSSWAQYTVQLPEGVCRDSVRHHLQESGIPTGVYYPIPLHQQKVYSSCLTATGPSISGSLPVCEKLARSVLSLPMSPYLTNETLAIVAQNLICALRKPKHS